MLIKLITVLLCLISVTVASNAQAIFTAELDDSDYEWLEQTEASGQSHLQIGREFMDETSTLYKYEYTSRDLVQDISHTYAPWHGSNEWQSSDSTAMNVKISRSGLKDDADRSSSLSVRTLLLIVSCLIGIFSLSKDGGLPPYKGKSPKK